MVSQPRILVASTPDGQYLAKYALSDNYILKFVSTLREAHFVLSESDSVKFDLVIAGIHFDDSRMFDLLQYVRQSEDYRHLPFLVIQAQKSAIELMDNIKSTAQNLDACGFLQLQNLNVEPAARLLKAAVDDALFGKGKSGS